MSHFAPRHRRLSRTALGGAACALVLAAQALAAEPAHPHWTYQGHGGPAEWGHLSHDFEACGIGRDQSPIDIAAAVPARLDPIPVHYQPQGLAVVNNGHTIQVNFKPGNFIELGSERYDLLQVHFHHPSEHAVGGQASPMELHLVHKGAHSGDLAVIGVMMVAGKANPAIQAVWDSMPAEEGPEKRVADVTLDPSALLPANRAYFRYEGSLTTPPCSEVVHWINLKDPIEVSQAQIDGFAKLFPMNARPLQPLNRRFILESEAR